jgi:hypothetical protein
MPSAQSATSSRVLIGVLVTAFVLAGAVRLVRLSAPGVLVDRDYLSAIVARDLYFRHAPGVEEWRREMASALRLNQPVREPPVTQFVVSLMYRVAASEQMWLARLLTIAFWLVGGILLYRFALLLTDPQAAVAATLYYLFVPSGILLSRSFQPDALMMLTFLGSLWAMLMYFERPSTGTVLVAAAAAGATLLHRPLVLFTLGGAFVALTLVHHGPRAFFRRHALVYAAVSLLPMTLYYGYGILVADYLREQADVSFRPHLLVHREFWKGWFEIAVSEAGAVALVGGLAGVPFLRGNAVTVVTGMAIGYVLFGLVFTMHIHTHGYYQAQLIPVIAIPLGALIAVVVGQIRQRTGGTLAWVPVVGAVALWLAIGVDDVRNRLGAQVFESEQTAQEIGAQVRHSDRVVFLSRYYGMPLQYYGEFTGMYWPRSISYWLYRMPGERELTIEERLADLGFTPEFFVITDFREYEEHHADLKEYLTRHCQVVAEEREYRIYDACDTSSSRNERSSVGEVGR